MPSFSRHASGRVGIGRLATVTHALITTQLHNCNALCLGLHLKSIQKLQLVQNEVAASFLQFKHSEHITALLGSCIVCHLGPI